MRYFCWTPYDVKVSGESASAEVKAAEEFLESLDDLTVEENCFPEKIFNMDGTSLFWKLMPERTFIQEEASACQTLNDEIILLGINIAGYKLKPFTIWQNENNRVFKNISNHTLPGLLQKQ